MILWLPAPYMNWLYRIDGARYNGRFVFTNTVPKGSHHGGIFGRMSAGWMQHLNRVAESVGIDPMEFHLKNAVEQGDVAMEGSEFASCGLKECIEKAAERSGWKDKYGKLPKYHGIGMGIGAQASGSKGADNDTSAAMIKVADDGIVTLYTGIPDMGQGSHTVMSMIAAEVLGTVPEDIRVVQGRFGYRTVRLGCVFPARDLHDRKRGQGGGRGCDGSSWPKSPRVRTRGETGRYRVSRRQGLGQPLRQRQVRPVDDI